MSGMYADGEYRPALANISRRLPGMNSGQRKFMCENGAGDIEDS